MAKTPFINKCYVLSEFFLEYKDEEQFKEFIEWANLAVPLAYFVTNGIIEPNEQIERFVDEAWEMLLKQFKLKDSGFEDFFDFQEAAYEKGTLE